MGRAPWRLALTIWTGLISGVATAEEYRLDLGPGFDVSWKNKFAIGAQLRLESPNKNFIGKSNLDPDLCAVDSCLTLTRDNNEPNERWQAAPGGAWQIGDEANLTHDKGDITSAVARWRSDLVMRGGDGSWGFKLGWQAFHDEVQYNLDLAQPNLIIEEGLAPGAATSVRTPTEARRESGQRLEIRDALAFFRVPYGDGRELDVSIGRRQLGWGEALFAISGTLNFINPVNFNNFFRPTMDLDEALSPVGMIALRTEVTDIISAEAFYQLEWRPYELPSRGTLGSFIVDLGSEPEGNGSLGGDSLPLPFGKTPEDPMQLQRGLTPVVALISDSAASIPRLANREPGNGGQYGFKFSMFQEDWLGGTELSAYYANYHARLPTASFIAAQSTCAAAEGSATGTDPTPGLGLALTTFLAACGTGSGMDLGSLLAQLTGQEAPRLVGEGFDALPLSSARIFLEYPEDIQVFGLPIDQLGGATFTDRRNAIPDYLTAYRGGTPGEVEPGAYIRGYEEFDYWQATAGGTVILGRDNNWIRADQMVLILEFAASYVPDLPSLNALQLDSLATTNTHYSAGVLESGDPLKLNPYQADADGFPTKLAWGYKAAAIWAYDDTFLQGLRIRPQVILFHDVDGTTPGLGGNFQDGRKIGLLGVNFNFYNTFNFSLDNFIFFGGGNGNRLRDRDFLNVSLSYEF